MPNFLVEVRQAIPQLYTFPGLRGDYQNPPFRIAGIPHLDDSSFRLLQEQVFRSGRQITLLVHPFAGENGPEVLFPASEEYRTNRDDLIRNSLGNGLPIVIAEPNSSFDKLGDKVESIAEGKGVLFALRTLEGDATPVIFEGYTGNYPFWSPREISRFTADAWFQITDVLKDAGVKRAVVGGRYLGFHQVTSENGTYWLERFKNVAKDKSEARKWLSLGLVPSGCVAEVAYRSLVAGFDTSFSTVSSPANSLEPTDFSAQPGLWSSL